jgi:membrane associated rhomboid family serine protease
MTAYLCATSRPPLVNRPAEPIFNVPPIIIGTIAAFAFVHVWRTLVLTGDEDLEFLLQFAFIPARYSSAVAHRGVLGGNGADIWTFVTYAFIHGDIVHLGVNTVWLLPFGTAVARRFGVLRFLAFVAATAAAGAALHLATHIGELAPMIGASAVISGFMAAAIRFAFQRGGPLGVMRAGDAEAYRVPAAPLGEAFRDPRTLAFLIVWFGLNFLFGLGSVGMLGIEESVAWQAHIGGFLAGLLLFALFDPVPARINTP